MKDIAILASMIAIVLLVLLAAPLIWWYKSSVQADVYRRQGVEMTTWECMMGAKPAERTFQMKDSK